MKTDEFLRSEIEERFEDEKEFEDGVDYINKWWKKAIKRYTKLHDSNRLGKNIYII